MRFLRRFVKWALRILLILLFILVLIVIALQFPAVQTRIAGVVTSELASRTGTEISIERVGIRIPKSISLKGVYLEDHRADTLLYAGELNIDVRIFALFRNHIDVKEILLRDATVNLLRLEPDTMFTYDILLNAIGGAEAGNDHVHGAEDQHEPDTGNDRMAATPEPDKPEYTAAPADGPGGSPWRFDVGNIRLDNIRFRYADHFSGMDLHLTMEALHTSVDILDPEAGHFALGDTRFHNGRVDMLTTEGTRPPEPREEPATPPEVGLSHLSIREVGFLYMDEDEPVFHTFLETLELEPDIIDLEAMLFNMRTVNAFVPETRVAGMDFSDLHLNLKNTLYSPDTLSSRVEHLSVLKGSGFQLSSLSADMHIGEHSSIEDLILETGESAVRATLFTTIPVLKSPIQIEERHQVDIRQLEGHIGEDLVILVPELDMLFPGEEPPPLEFIVHAAGTVGDLLVDTVHAELNGKLSVAASGRVSGYPDMSLLLMDIPGFRVSAAPAAMMAYLPKQIREETLQLPPELLLSGSIQGSTHDFLAEASLFTEFLQLDAEFDYLQTDDEVPEWNARVQLEGAEPLAVIGQPGLIRDLYAGMVAQGAGFDPETMDMHLELLVDSVVYNNYTYKALEIVAEGSNGLWDSRILYEDEHLVLDAMTGLSLGEGQPAVSLQWELDHMNARELGFTEEMLAVQTQVEGEFTMYRPDFPDGWLHIHETHVLLDRDVFFLDSLHLKTETNDRYYMAEIYSPMLEGSYTGNFSPADIPLVLADHTMTYLGMERDPEEGYVVEEDPEIPDRHFELSLRIRPSPYIHELLLPQIDSYDTITIQSRYQSADRILSLQAELPEMLFGDWHITGLRLNAGSDADVLGSNLHVASLESSAITIKDLSLDGDFSDRILAFQLAFDDMDDVKWLNMSGSLEQLEEYTEIRLDTTMLINREEWRVLPGNFIRILEDNIVAQNLRVHREDKEIAIRSTELENNMSPLEVTFRSIDMGRFDLIGGEPLLQGVLDGFFEVHDLYADFTFTADLNIEDLGFHGDTIGDVQLRVVSPEPDLFQIEASVRGFGNRVDLAGSYHHTDPPFLDVNLRLDNLELATLEALAFDQLKDMEGQISGDLNLTGDPANPDFEGAIHFDQVGFFATFLNVRYTIPEESIVFDQHTIRFSEFTLLDRSDRPASLDGTISLHDLANISFDLSLTSTNFLLLDVTRDADEMFFGRLLIDTDLSMRGDIVRPVIEGRLKLNQGSNFTFIPPQYMPEAIGDEGVVEFIAPYEYVFPELALRPEKVEGVQSAFENLDISVNVEIDPATDVRVIIDEVAGDYLEVQGGGMITYGVEPGGRITLAGSYEITQGAYQMTFYDVIRRNFQIERGSNIVWTGEPLEATIDITAKYTVRTSARELMAAQGTGGAQQETAYRQIYPFEVFLNMEGDLMNPEIHFEIGLPAEHRGAMEGRLQSRINELNESESELNKQVFALLILGNFIQDDPIAAVTAGPGITSTARTSASRMLSQQMNRLSDRYIRGVDISFELESYEQVEDGQMVGRTELQMEVSRDFLDDRLRITAGGHLELEDETRRQINPADMAGDFSVEYLLTPDGRFIVKGFRERKFQEVFDGEVIETGMSLIFRQTFNNFRDLVTRREEETEVTVDETNE